jgi:hypothetical protein
MAKQLKVIKCPQCGSTNKTELRTDHFRCNNCNTGYFLDNDDITIHHRVAFEETPPGGQKPATLLPVKRGALILVIVVSIILAIISATSLLFTDTTSDSSLRPPPREEEETFNWFFNDKAAYISAEGKPVEVIVGERMYSGSAYETKKGVYAAFYDLQTGKELAAEKVPGVSTDISGGKYAAVSFKNGDLYFIVEKTRIFKVNKSSLSLTDVTQSLFAQQPKLTSGIANAEAIYKSNGEGFNLIANDGVNYFYYPAQDRLYTKEEKRAAEDALSIAQSGEPLQVGFRFSSSSSDYPEEKQQLIRYLKRDAQGGPDEEPYFEWSKDFRSGVKTLERWHKSNVRSYKDLTPGRQYFDPEVLYGDNKMVLISFANTPAEESARSLQCLDATTGAIQFTLPISSKYHLGTALHYPDGFVIDNNTSMLLVSHTGKLLNEVQAQ